KTPKWWIWYSWICPVAWTVYGLIVSQFGDITDLIEVDGKQPGKQLNQYLDEYFGYNNDFMGAIAVVLIGFTFFFAIIFAFGIKLLNFQHRYNHQNVCGLLLHSHWQSDHKDRLILK
ncbi:hypothetical protein KI387_025747, partial [Taxus chinensis]